MNNERAARANIVAELRTELKEIRDSGTFKHERPIAGGQGARVLVDGDPLLNFCSNDYLGLANRPSVRAAAHDALEEWGFGMSSVRFICGTQDQHIRLEAEISRLVKTDGTILFPSCFAANGAVFAALLDERDAVFSDALNHASIIDGIRLCKAQRFRYENRDLHQLEEQLRKASGARRRLIVTDGVFSMDGYYAPLPEICDLADEYEALVLVDDSHATGFIGQTGGGTPELFGVQDRVDILTSTLGKALGGASGGFVSGRAEIVETLRQRGRPYLFSNTIPPVVVGGTRAALELVINGGELRERIARNSTEFRDRMTEAGFTLLPGNHPITPVMFADEHEAAAIAEELLTLGVYVTAFSYPVVPLGQSRIRVQVSAAHSSADIDSCVNAFVEARRRIRDASR